MMLVGELEVKEHIYLINLSKHPLQRLQQIGRSFFSRFSNNGCNSAQPPPPFVKKYHAITHPESLQIPLQWVRSYGRNMPYQCFLVMPHGRKWDVRLLNVENGCYFRAGWSSFANANNINTEDTLIFMHIRDGVFQVIRTCSLTSCPPLYDYDGAFWPIPESDVVPDLDTSDDYDSSKADFVASSDEEDDILPIEYAVDEHLSFTITFNETTITKTLELPIRFWKKFIREGDMENETYFTVGRRTWEMRIAKRNGRIRVKRGWSHFKQVNRLQKGMTCSFYLVDTEEVHFYVIIQP
ncbi:B3 domain-containing protein REM20-like [Salvia splendens]|uniref:B3 domain-containing protein REM20-like n=1 Tax=Salvia splendens TaxID=180675 RepID=UPI001C268EAF|nr:B3 domain-containing protein REM20-like [Salvia splendens]